MPLCVHPESGLHYFIVLPMAWGPFVDHVANYMCLARTTPWLSVVDIEDYPAILDQYHDDPTAFFLLWVDLPTPTYPRRCLITVLYMEALADDATQMLPAHVAHRQRFIDQAASYDAIFAHTPRMVEALGTTLRLPAFLLPAGWSPEGMGRPRLKHAHRRLIYWGSPVGRRAGLMPLIQQNLNPGYLDASGNFGRTLLGFIETSAAALYVAHSNVWSFSTWRLWQGLAAGTPHIAEPGDTWPFIINQHYVPFTPFEGGLVDPNGDLADPNTFHNQNVLKQIIHCCRDDLNLKILREAALDDLADRFTVQRCVEDYLVPASLTLRSLRP